MRKLFFACLLLPAACVTDAGVSTSSLGDGSVVHTVRCDDTWDGCYRSANRICGERGFDEVDRSVASSLDTAGRLDRMHTVEGAIDDHRYSETTREAVFERMITIRCRQTQ
ncbi:MAG: hypothetical protein P8X98_04420 [Woeseiaceae bacterium]|jgi:hypothetical protein